MFRNLPPLSKGIIVALVVSVVVSILVPSLTVSVLPLFPELVRRGQVWRLITYPFFMFASMHDLLGSLFTLLWNGFIVVLFGAELETIVHTRQLAWALTGSVIVGGVVFSFLSPEGALAGPGIMTLFLLAGFAYLWPKREISIWGLFWVKSWIVALAIYVLSIIPMNGMQLDTSATNLFGPTFGAIAALLYFHVVYRQYLFGRGFLNRIDGMFGRRSRAGTGSRSRVNAGSVQTQIDAILDKIASHGMQSLSKEEREFLLKNSQ